MPGKTSNKVVNDIATNRSGSSLALARQSGLWTPEISAAVDRAQKAGRSAAQGWEFTNNLQDALGRGLDPEMVAPMAAFHFLGLPTTACCQGHPSEQRPRAHQFPWIDFSPPREQGEALLSALTAWTIVQRGQGVKRSYRFNPAEIKAINDRRFAQHPYQYWQTARQQLSQLATAILEH